MKQNKYYNTDMLLRTFYMTYGARKNGVCLCYRRKLYKRILNCLYGGIKNDETK